MKKINQLILGFIPIIYFSNEETLRKARSFVIVSFFTGIFFGYYLILCGYYNMPNVLIGMMFNVIAFPILPFMLKYQTLPLKWLGKLYIYTSTIGIISCALLTGGIDSSVLLCLSLLPLNSLLMAYKKRSWHWTIITMIYISIIGILVYSSVVFMYNTQVNFKHFIVIANLVGFGVILFLIALRFENAQNKSLEKQTD